MIVIVHGDDIEKSRGYFFEAKQKANPHLSFEGKNLSLPDLTQALQGSGLFGETPAIFIEEFLSKRKPSKETEKIIQVLNSAEADIILWESKELTAKQLSLLKKAQIKLFKLPKHIFAFLDSLNPGNNPTMIKLFHQTLTTQDEQFIFTMLIRHIRLLLALSPLLLGSGVRETHEHASLRSTKGEGEIEPGQTIDELKRLAPWQRSKLEKQSVQFTTEQLLQIHHQLFEIDLAQKTGNLSMSLTQSLDFLLAQI